ncbi:MAG: hypothetical protein RLN76_13805 [Phycisphaeraceae bacterium]
MGRWLTESTWGRRLLFTVLYFSEGAPIGYLWWAMPVRLSEAGMGVERVSAIMAALTLPWVLKFLWAPVVDALQGPRWGLRASITLAQVVMGLALVPLAVFPLEDLLWLGGLLLMTHAVAAATQDVGIDALAIRVLPEAERGTATGWMQAGMLAARSVFGGLSLWAERYIGPQGVVVALIGCIWFSMTLVWLVPAQGSSEGLRGVGARLWSTVGALSLVIRKQSLWLGLGVAMTAGAGFEAVGGLIGPMLVERGVEAESIGAFRALPVVGCMVVGSLLGGILADRMGHRRLVISSVVMILAAVMLLMVVDESGVRGVGLMSAALPVFLALGSLTSASYAMFMDLSDPRVGGTQFSAYMSATNLCEMWAVALAGMLAGAYGYGLGFGVVAGLSLVSIPLVMGLSRPK